MKLNSAERLQSQPVRPDRLFPSFLLFIQNNRVFICDFSHLLVNNPPQFNFESQEYFLLPRDDDSPRLMSLTPFSKSNPLVNKKSLLRNIDDFLVGQPSAFQLEEYPSPADDLMDLDTAEKDAPLPERLRSSNWRTRMNAYEELALIFEQSWDDEVFEKYAKKVIEIMMDYNPSAQGKALETMKVYLSECDCSHLNYKLALKVLVRRVFRKSLAESCFEIVYFLFEKCDKKELIDTLINLMANKNPKVPSLSSL